MTLLSPQWFRVASLRPRLDAQAQVQRVTYRGEVWHVLVRADASRSFRLNAAAYAFVARCDGKLSLQRLWDVLLAEFKDDAPTQDELLNLLGRLHAAALLAFDRTPDFGPQAVQRAQPDDTARRRGNSLLSFRIPVGHPDAWLSRLAPHFGWLFTPWMLAAWIATVLLGVIGAALNAGLLAAHVQTWMNTPRMLTLVWLAYPVVKALHELAHALALKHLGGRVPEWGISLMMFTPVPYVDASAASALARPADRLLVSAAGIMLELLLAAFALAVALNVEPGWLRDLALAVFFIGTVSTLLVNGNPLLRFDGYHVLTDALELPNLASRSAQHWRLRMRAVALRETVASSEVSSLVPAPGERPWLWGYAPAALVYRWIVSLAIVAWLGSVSVLLGAGIALYLAWGLVVMPLAGAWRWLHGAALADAQRRAARRRVFAAAAVVVLAVGAVPLPFASVAQGVVWLPEQALVRAETEGFIDTIDVADGAAVRTGQRLFTLNSPALLAEQSRLQGRLTELETERFQTLRADPARAVSVEHDWARVTAELARADERVAQLGVHASADGTAAISHADDLSGRFVKQGAVLAHVLVPANRVVRVALPQEQASLVQGSTRSVSVRLADDAATARPGVLLRDVAGAVRKLPSAALGERSGGPIATDPKDTLVPAQGVVLADVQLAADLGPRVGARAWVRFDHGLAPLAWQLARRAQQLFLKHFNPSQ